MSLDAAHEKLALAHLGDNSVVVVSTQSKKALGTIGNVRQVHGVLAVPEMGRIYATATGSDELVVIDEPSLAILARVPVGRYPDGLAYAPSVSKIYVSDKEGKTESVVDARTNKRVATIDLGGAVGNTQYDPVSRHIFINVEGTGGFVEVDPATDKIIDRMRLPSARGNHGLLIEPNLRLAFIACEGNDKLLVLDLHTKRVAAQFTVDGEPDVLAYDPGRKILYVATESGPVHLFRLGPDGTAKIGSIRVGPNAHTLAVNPDTHELYIPLNQPRPILRVMQPAG
ncbi:YncE family protein [Massilia horti]|nr:YncE family protein [Massilia horti]